MKKVLLSVMIAISCSAAFAQHSIFMQILENKKICNKEDQLTYFLQANSFERLNEDHYYHHYAIDGSFYTTCIINRNECYVIYQTNNAKDYNKILKDITGTCHKEYAADKSVSYVCNLNRIQDAQVMFLGYSQADKTYEIMVYQNPDAHEVPYSQADRSAPASDIIVKAKEPKKKVKRTVKTVTTTTKTGPAKAAATPAVTTTTVTTETKKTTKPQVTNTSAPIIGVKKTTAPPIK